MKPAIDKCAEMIRSGKVIKAIHDVFGENPELPAVGDLSDPHDLKQQHDHDDKGTLLYLTPSFHTLRKLFSWVVASVEIQDSLSSLFLPVFMSLYR